MSIVRQREFMGLRDHDNDEVPSRKLLKVFQKMNLVLYE
jgi:hypothetical protein